MVQNDTLLVFVVFGITNYRLGGALPSGQECYWWIRRREIGESGGSSLGDVVDYRRVCAIVV